MAGDPAAAVDQSMSLGDCAGMPPDALRRVLHEMRMRQVELEMELDELRCMHAGVAQERDYLLAVVNSISDEVWCADQDGHFMLINPVGLREFGVDPHAAVDVAKLVAALEVYRGDGSPRPPEEAPPLRALAGEIIREEEEIVRTPNRQELRCRQVSASPVRDSQGRIIGSVSVVRDITDRKRVEESLRVKTAVFDHSITANSIANAEGVLTEVNDDFLKIWGYASKGEVIGKPIAHFLMRPEETAAILTVLDTEDRWEGIYTAKRGDGSAFTAHSLGHVLRNAKGQITGYHSAVQDITERQRTEDALRESEAKLRRLHESMMDAFVSVDMDGRIIDCNRAYQEMLGYPEDELRRMTYTDITPEKWHAVEARLVAGQVMPRGFSEIYEKEYRRKDGTVIPVELRTYLVRDDHGAPLSMWAIIRDISERKKAEQTVREWNKALEHRVAERTAELKQTEVRFRQLAEISFEGIAISEDGILTDGNTQLGTLHGYELAEMLGRPVMDFVAPKSRAMVVNAMRKGKEASYECFGLRKDGSTFPAEVHARMGLWHGKVMRITALRDLTQAKQTEAQLQAQQAELEHAQRLSLISEVSAGIIHQIGQPLCAMGANLAVIIAKLSACTAKRCGALPIAREMEDEVRGMRDVMIHMRSLANAMRPNHEPVDLRRLPDGVLGLLRREAEPRRIWLAVRMEDNLPRVLADAVQLDQVVLNLVRNAFDACASCPPEQRVVACTIRAVAGPSVELSVCDSGTGIAPEVMEHLFTPFFTTKAKGLGVGLRLSRTIVEAHGGTIEATNNPEGVGATFRVILPAIPAADDTSE